MTGLAMEFAAQQDSVAPAKREEARRELLKWIVKNEALRRDQRKAAPK
jgi:hypothetical protein